MVNPSSLFDTKNANIKRKNQAVETEDIIIIDMTTTTGTDVRGCRHRRFPILTLTSASRTTTGDARNLRMMKPSLLQGNASIGG